MTQITLRYFAAAAEAAGVDEEPWELGTEPTLDALRSGLSRRYGTAMSRVLRTGSFLVDGTVRRDGGALEVTPEGTVVDVLPPFAGG